MSEKEIENVAWKLFLQTGRAEHYLFKKALETTVRGKKEFGRED